MRLGSPSGCPSSSLLLLSLLLLLGLLVGDVEGWNCYGHMLTARIAYDCLFSSNKRKADALIHNFSKNGPFPQSPDFVQAACWLDDLRTWGMDAMDAWHYIRLAHVTSKPTVLPNVTDVKEMNIVRAIESMIKTLRTPNSPTFAYSFALVSLINLFADLHQPLNVIELYDTDHPQGDAGGNAFKVLVKGREYSLHELSNNFFLTKLVPYPRPLSDSKRIELLLDAGNLPNLLNFTASETSEINVHSILKESHEIALNSSYQDAKEGKEVSNHYLKKCWIASLRRVTLAGLRLGNLLNGLLDNLDLDVNAIDPLPTDTNNANTAITTDEKKQTPSVLEEDEEHPKLPPMVPCRRYVRALKKVLNQLNVTMKEVERVLKRHQDQRHGQKHRYL